jgi:hypothetical protein
MVENQNEAENRQNDGPGGTLAEKERKILSKLLFDESKFLNRLEETVQHATNFFGIEPQTGRVVLTAKAKKLKGSDQIRVLLTGRYFAYKLNIIPTDKMNYKEIAAELGRPVGSVSAELTYLIRSGDLQREDEDGLVWIPFHRVDSTLREIESPSDNLTNETEGEQTTKAAVKRIPRQRADPVIQAMLERVVDLSSYTWMKNVDRALDKGLAGLMIAKDIYGQEQMTCQQLAAFLKRTFPISVTREAISMAFMKVKSQFITPIAHGNEITYSLLPLGRQRIQEVAASIESKRTAGSS